MTARFRLLVWLQTALAAVTGVAFVGRKNFWLDESYSFIAAHRDLADLARLVVHDESNMAAYYLGLHFWLDVGRSEGTLRLLSVPFFVAAVPVCAVLGRQLVSPAAGLLAGLLTALNPMAVEYGQEARSYSMLLLVSAGSTLLFVGLVTGPAARGRQVAWAVVTGLSVYVHYFSLLVPVAQLASLLVLPDAVRRLRSLLPALALVTLLVLPQVAMAAVQGGSKDLPGADEPSLLLPGRLLHTMTGSLVLMLPVVVVLAVSLAATAGVVRREGRGEDSWRLLLLWSWLAVPPSIAFVVSFVKPLWSDRYLIVSLPALLLLLGHGVTVLADRRLRGLAAAVLVITSLVALGTYYREPVKAEADWRAATAFLQSGAEPGDAMWNLPGKESVNQTFYAWRRERPELPDLSRATDAYAGQIHPRQLPPRQVRRQVRAQQRVWVVTKRQVSTAGASEANARTKRRVQRVLGPGFRLVSRERFGSQLTVSRYERR